MFIVRNAEDSDIPAMTEYMAAVSKEAEFANTVTKEDVEKQMVFFRNSEVNFYFLALDDEKIVGSMTIHYQKTWKTVYIGDLRVLKSHQGKGISTLLRLTAENLARKKSAKKLSLHVDGTNTKGLAVYKKWGFREIGKVIEMELILLTKSTKSVTESAIYNRW